MLNELLVRSSQDIIYYLIGVLNDPRAYGQCYDVGCDDILSNNRAIDLTAELLGRNHPLKLDVPQPLMSALAPLIERATKLQKGSIQGFLDCMNDDTSADPMPIRMILPRSPLSYRQAVKLELGSAAKF